MISRYPIIGGDVGVKHGVTPPGLTPPYKVRIYQGLNVGDGLFGVIQGTVRCWRSTIITKHFLIFKPS